ncbi:hypothetical protein F5Y06DRAFT_302773 [Hypoxylon sp. FL0890]|nr:hypothetical protein F5Y06DRAFT_302773 [Hypoxylon sp. FL0890]
MSDYLEYFDFDAFSGTDEYTFDFNDLDNTAPIGQEEQNSAIDSNALLLPNATAAPVEPPMNAKAETEPLDAQPYSSSTNSETHDFREPRVWFESIAGAKNHRHDLDESDHHRVQGVSQNSCAACNTVFSTNFELEGHAFHEGHGAFVCSCSTVFTRLDALRRHVASLRKEIPKFPCTFCKRHRGKHGFRRRDHLVQHLSGYHKFDPEEIGKVCPPQKRAWDIFWACPLPGCEFHRGEAFHILGRREKKQQAPFSKRSSYYKHLKDVHGVTPFPCPVAGCERVDAKGYVVERGLEKHLAREHSNSSQHLAKFREELCQQLDKCAQSGVDIWGLGDFNILRRLLHQL